MLLSLSVASSIAISTPNYVSAQGVLEGLEREQSGESVPGEQPADIGGSAPLNATTTVEGGSSNKLMPPLQAMQEQPAAIKLSAAHLPYMVVEAANRELQHLSTPSQKQMSIPTSN
jgi:hypothetical protein